MRLFRISNLRQEAVDYFTKLTLALMDERKNKGLVYNDFISLLMQSESQQVEKSTDENGRIVKKLTQEEIVG